jgi:hypothetical protein
MAPIISRLSSLGGGGTGGFSFGKRKVPLAAVGGVKASGGTIIPSAESGNGYTYHVFLYPNTDSLVVNTAITADVLIVAGGGAGGGNFYAGGGGAGGVVYGPNVPLSAASHTISVGKGGDKAAGAQGGSGSNSLISGPIIGTITAVGGGGGGPVAALPGGSGGGSGQYSNTTTPAAPQPVPGLFTAYGNASTTTTGYGDGGGGAGGGNLAAPAPTRGGHGGAGQPFPGFPSTILAPAIPAPIRSRWSPAVGPTGYFGGGGGGANYYTTTVRPYGGLGGGGEGGGGINRGPVGEYDNGDPGVNFTGGGGGGANYVTSTTNPLNPTPGAGGDGGHGIVIVRYQ